MSEFRDAGFSWKKSGNTGSVPTPSPFQTLEYTCQSLVIALSYFFPKKVQNTRWFQSVISKSSTTIRPKRGNKFLFGGQALPSNGPVDEPVPHGTPLMWFSRGTLYRTNTRRYSYKPIVNILVFLLESGIHGVGPRIRDSLTFLYMRLNSPITYVLRPNPSENWVIAIFSGQKTLYQNNLSNIVFIFTFFKGHRYNLTSAITPVQRLFLKGARENKWQISQELWKHRQNSENFMCGMSFCEIWHLFS